MPMPLLRALLSDPRTPEVCIEALAAAANVPEWEPEHAALLGHPGLREDHPLLAGPLSVYALIAAARRPATTDARRRHLLHAAGADRALAYLGEFPDAPSSDVALVAGMDGQRARDGSLRAEAAWVIAMHPNVPTDVAARALVTLLRPHRLRAGRRELTITAVLRHRSAWADLAAGAGDRAVASRIEAYLAAGDPHEAHAADLAGPSFQLCPADIVRAIPVAGVVASLAAADASIPSLVHRAVRVSTRLPDHVKFDVERAQAPYADSRSYAAGHALAARAPADVYAHMAKSVGLHPTWQPDVAGHDPTMLDAVWHATKNEGDGYTTPAWRAQIGFELATRAEASEALRAEVLAYTRSVLSRMDPQAHSAAQARHDEQVLGGVLAHGLVGAALRLPASAYLPTDYRVLAAGLSGRRTDLGDPEFVTAMLALSDGHFPGTLGELLDTATTIAAPTQA